MATGVSLRTPSAFKGFFLKKDYSNWQAISDGQLLNKTVEICLLNKSILSAIGVDDMTDDESRYNEVKYLTGFRACSCELSRG